MINRDIIAIGASMGGIDALQTLVKDLPADLPAAIFVVVHIGAYGSGMLPEILARAGNLPAQNAKDGSEFTHGRIYVAPADHHLLVLPPRVIRTTRGPKENRSRPAVDPLFRSAAAGFGPRVIGVVLTGALDDGTAGLWAIKDRGGVAIVQDPAECVAPSMPQSAIQNVQVDHVVPLRDLGRLLVRLVNTPIPVEQEANVPKRMETEINIANEVNGMEAGVMKLGAPSVYACPECHGVLLQVKEGNHVRFRCHTGHAFSLESLLADCYERTEETLWQAIRAIEESTVLMEHIATQMVANGFEAAAEQMRKKAHQAHLRANIVRKAVMERAQLEAPASHSEFAK